MSLSKGEQLVVTLAASQEDYEFVTKLAAGEQWTSAGVHSLPHLGPILEPGFFIGYLNGHRIGHVCAIKYGTDDSTTIYYVGFYIVEKGLRGNGYGSKIRSVMWESLPKHHNIFLDGLLSMVPLYEKIGFKKEWINKEYIMSSSKVIESLQKRLPPTTNDIVLKPLNEVEFTKLFEYDMSVFGFPRHKFLKKWTTIPESIGWAAVNFVGNVIGYTVIRYSVIDKHLNIAPLYADDIEIARHLLFTAATAALQQKSIENLEFFIPASVNADAIDLIESEIGCESMNQAVRMYTMGIPQQVCVKKMIAITSPGFG